MYKNLIKSILKRSLILILILGTSIAIIPKSTSASNKIFKGNISISEYTTYKGKNAAIVNINTDGFFVDDVDLENEPDHLDEAYVDGKILIYGLRDNVIYNNLYIELELYNSNGKQKHIYKINSFSYNPNSQTNIGQSNNNFNNSTTFGNTEAISNYLKTVYTNIFEREIDQQGLNYWTNMLSSYKIELEDFFINLLSENEFLNIAPTVEDKIKKLYHGIFQREPDAQGFNYWVYEYRKELIKKGNERKALKEVIDDMTDSQEFKSILQKLGLKK